MKSEEWRVKSEALSVKREAMPSGWLLSPLGELEGAVEVGRGPPYPELTLFYYLLLFLDFSLINSKFSPTTGIPILIAMAHPKPATTSESTSPALSTTLRM